MSATVLPSGQKKRLGREPPYLVDCCPRLLYPVSAGRASANPLERGFSSDENRSGLSRLACGETWDLGSGQLARIPMCPRPFSFDTNSQRFGFDATCGGRQRGMLKVSGGRCGPLASLLSEPSDTVSSQNTTGRHVAAPHQIRALSHHDNPVRYMRRLLQYAASTAGIASKPCHLFATRGACSYGKVSGPVSFFSIARHWML
jgi:hypothetical protein